MPLQLPRTLPLSHRQGVNTRLLAVSFSPKIQTFPAFGRLLPDFDPADYDLTEADLGTWFFRWYRVSDFVGRFDACQPGLNNLPLHIATYSRSNLQDLHLPSRIFWRSMITVGPHPPSLGAVPATIEFPVGTAIDFRTWTYPLWRWRESLLVDSIFLPARFQIWPASDQLPDTLNLPFL